MRLIIYILIQETYVSQMNKIDCWFIIVKTRTVTYVLVNLNSMCSSLNI